MALRDGLSAILIAKDASSTIAETLASLEFCDAIIVLDSGSQDDTVAIARSFGAKVVETDWLGYGIQKQRALSFVDTGWALSIDCDEVVSGPLRHEILTNLESPAFNVYRMPRLNHLCRRAVQCAGWYPDYVERLFRVDQAHFSDALVHESLQFSCPCGTLRAPLLHYTYDNLESAIDKLNRYSSLAAVGMRSRGRQVAPWTPPFRFLFRFFSAYLLRGGCLGGLDGFTVSLLQAVEVYFKYLKTMG